MAAFAKRLAAGMTAAPAHEWFQVKGLIAAKPTTHVRYRGHTGKHMLVLSFTGFDPKQTLAGLNPAAQRIHRRSPITFGEGLSYALC
jgi:hypothetical protein